MDNSNLRKFLHDLISPLAAASLILESLTEDVAADRYTREDILLQLNRITKCVEGLTIAIEQEKVKII